MEKRTGSQKLNCPVRCSERLNWDSHPFPHSPSREWELSTSFLAQGSLSPSQIGTHLKTQDFSVFIQASKKTAKLDLLIYYLLCQKQCCTVSGVLCLIESLLLSFLKLLFTSRSRAMRRGLLDLRTTARSFKNGRWFSVGRTSRRGL